MHFKNNVLKEALNENDFKSKNKFENRRCGIVSKVSLPIFHEAFIG